MTNMIVSALNRLFSDIFTFWYKEGVLTDTIQCLPRCILLTSRFHSVNERTSVL